MGCRTELKFSKTIQIKLFQNIFAAQESDEPNMQGQDFEITQANDQPGHYLLRLDVSGTDGATKGECRGIGYFVSLMGYITVGEGLPAERQWTLAIIFGVPRLYAIIREQVAEMTERYFGKRVLMPEKRFKTSQDFMGRIPQIPPRPITGQDIAEARLEEDKSAAPPRAKRAVSKASTAKKRPSKKPKSKTK